MTSNDTQQLRLGDVAPDFKADTTHGPIQFHEWAGDSWVVFFSHPKDFTPVCTTELGEVARLKPEFEKRGVKRLALSVDSVDEHKAWIGDIEDTQRTTVDYPIIGDSDRSIALAYGMIHPNASETFTVRTVFVIDPAKKVRLSLTYPAPTGRNFAEIMRVIDALQLTDSRSVATPANWEPGGDCIILPSITDPKELEEKFPSGYTELRPYLRVTAQPS